LNALRKAKGEFNLLLGFSYHFRPLQLFKRNHGNLSGVTGGRAPSFRDLSVGETAALSLSKGMRRGQAPPQINYRKDQLGSLGTKERLP
jgi:hypothetical protein